MKINAHCKKRKRLEVMFIQVISWKWGKEGKIKAREAGSAGMMSSQELKFGADEPK